MRSISTWPQTKTIMVLGSQYESLKTSLLESLRPLGCVEFIGLKDIGILVSSTN
jgi:hypothetical protein